MRAVIQRVSSASVTIEGRVVGAIERGLLVLLGVAQNDTAADGEWLAQKIAALRIFEDDAGKMNRSLRDLADAEQRTADGRPRTEPVTAPTPPAPSLPSSDLRPPSTDLRPLVLVVSQFTLFASTRKGTRPSFNDAAKPDLAIPLYENFLAQLATALGRPVARGEFGAMMQVALVNDGPVTLILDTQQRE